MACALYLLTSGLRSNPANTLCGDTAGDWTAEVQPGSPLVNPSFRLDRDMFLATAGALPEDAISCNTFRVVLDAAAIVTPARP
jgi:hypothetical protein